MEAGKVLFVRTDYKVDGTVTSEEDFNDHINYLYKVANERFFMGGGFIEKPGGMIVYEATNITEAKKVADGDPLIARGLYHYELVKWEMVLLSKNASSLLSCK